MPTSPTRLTRRDFLKQGAAAAGALAAAQAAPLSALAAPAPDIALAKGGPAEATRKAVEALGGMAAFVKPGQKVVIKPNMSFAAGPESAANTHPAVIAELMRLCKEAGASRVLVLDNCLADPAGCLKLSGIAAACEAIDKDCVHALKDERFFRKADIAGAKVLPSTMVMQDVLEADVLIPAPKAKSHGATGVTLSLKGMMGLIYERESFHRIGLDDAIVDLASLLKPKVKLVVIDATSVMTSGGPYGPGPVAKLDTVLAARDMVAADAQAVLLSEWYGQKVAPSQVRHIRYAADRGLGRLDVEKMTVVTVQA
jgi:uncharacterized protein (DUF362 family)